VTVTTSEDAARAAADAVDAKVNPPAEDANASTGDPLADEVKRVLGQTAAQEQLDKAVAAFDAAQLSTMPGDPSLLPLKEAVLSAEFDVSWASAQSTLSQPAEELATKARELRLAMEDKAFEQAELAKAGRPERAGIALEERLAIENQMQELSQLTKLKGVLELAGQQADAAARAEIATRYRDADTARLEDLRKTGTKVEIAFAEAEATIAPENRATFADDLKVAAQRALAQQHELIRKTHIEDTLRQQQHVTQPVEMGPKGEAVPVRL
jgi:hypothetical protein